LILNNKKFRDLHKEDSAVFRLAQDKGYTTNEQICHLSHSTKKGKFCDF
jgi:hypothetical protein